MEEPTDGKVMVFYTKSGEHVLKLKSRKVHSMGNITKNFMSNERDLTRLSTQHGDAANCANQLSYANDFHERDHTRSFDRSPKTASLSSPIASSPAVTEKANRRTARIDEINMRREVSGDADAKGKLKRVEYGDVSARHRATFWIGGVPIGLG
ncbi:hypothetical protein B296_00038353 [Ensete ventricosum]|uniref:Uncharacterized protein n=1 Tax=Ensete ventricosum TaxID=4639 RepID=A0A426XMM5_ENSVE|nr:hypothetical protein B296_00038353 [Ensete ventricosum]